MHIAGVKNSEQKQDNVSNPSYTVLEKAKNTRRPMMNILNSMYYYTCISNEN